MVNAFRPRRESDELSTPPRLPEAEADAAASSGIAVEHEVVVPRYPREFGRVKVKARYLGPGKPNIVLDAQDGE